jgi:hypothetical protein
MNWQRYLLIGILVLGLVAAIVLGVKGYKEIDQEQDNQLINSGELIERGASDRETINAIKNANDAVDNPTVNELNVVCDKYDRNC